MNRSSKGFGLVGVLVTVIVLAVAAVMSASASSTTMPEVGYSVTATSYTHSS
jgi:Tfp pilus assembly protein PilE